MTDTFICGICGERHPSEDLFLHLRVGHGIEEEPARWPDGRFVVIDETLEPADFLLDDPDQ